LHGAVTRDEATDGIHGTASQRLAEEAMFTYAFKLGMGIAIETLTE
jgi:hypothetical protein